MMKGGRAFDVLDDLKALLPNADAAVLDVLLRQCEADFKAICGRDDVPEAARSTLTQMAVCRYNALGAEGLTSQSYSGMSESYMADYAEPLKRAIYRFRRVTLL